MTALTFTTLDDMRTTCHRTIPTLSHGVAVCPVCGAIVADVCYGDPR
jgi:hypothetical protein